MAYDEHLADRIRQQLKVKGAAFEEKKMMGGLCFMVNDKMTIGIIKNELMARIDPAIEEEALKRKGARPMDFVGYPMTGYLYVNPSAIDDEEDLAWWVQLCLEFNPKAKSSKKKK